MSQIGSVDTDILTSDRWTDRRIDIIILYFIEFVCLYSKLIWQLRFLEIFTIYEQILLLLLHLFHSAAAVDLRFFVALEPCKPWLILRENGCQSLSKALFATSNFINSHQIHIFIKLEPLQVTE